MANSGQNNDRSDDQPNDAKGGEKQRKRKKRRLTCTDVLCCYRQKSITPLMDRIHKRIPDDGGMGKGNESVDVGGESSDQRR